MIVDGKMIANEMEKDLTEKLAVLPKKKLCFIIFGSDPASLQFIKMKSKVAERIGIDVQVLEQQSDIGTDKAIEIIQKTATENHDGVVVQLPLPDNLDTEKILNSVPENLDIDLLGREAKEKYKRGESEKVPPVARAVWQILNFYKIDLAGKKIIVIGSGRLVGQPISDMLTLKKIPFKMIDKNTDEKERFAEVEMADIIISGVGFPNLVKPEMIKDGVILIDAGTSKQNGKLVGDIDPGCVSKASLLTPVPGGVGPVTVMSLFANL